VWVWGVVGAEGKDRIDDYGLASVCVALIQSSSEISTRAEEGWAYTEVGLLGMELGAMDRSALT
jgi:hypothetical protein